MNESDSKTNLGRGLAALFGDDAEDVSASGAIDSRLKLPLEQLHPNPHQPRRRFEPQEIEALADSIKANGILQPILVRPHPSKTAEFEIVAGERRWRAAQRARLHEVPVVIHELDNARTLEIAILENIQRQDLTPLEEAEGFRALLEEFDYKQNDLALSLGKSRSHIANALRLLNLPDSLKALVDDGALSAGHARALLTAPNPEEAAQKVITKGLSVRQTEALVKKAKAAEKSGESPQAAQAKEKPSSPPKDANTRALEQDLSALLGLKVTIEIQGSEQSEAGAVTIHYESLEQLDDVLRRLSQAPGADSLH